MRSKESTICGGDEMDIQRYGRSVALGALAFASVASHAQTGNPGSPDSENGPEMAQSAQDAATSYGEPTLEGQSPTEVPIVVTGPRLREESVQDTPLAVSVLSERGRASGRDRVCQYVVISVVAVSL